MANEYKSLKHFHQRKNTFHPNRYKKSPVLGVCNTQSTKLFHQKLISCEDDFPTIYSYHVRRVF